MTLQIDKAHSVHSVMCATIVCASSYTRKKQNACHEVLRGSLVCQTALQVFACYQLQHFKNLCYDLEVIGSGVFKLLRQLLWHNRQRQTLQLELLGSGRGNKWWRHHVSWGGEAAVPALPCCMSGLLQLVAMPCSSLRLMLRVGWRLPDRLKLGSIGLRGSHLPL
jgi:hypothetical protein